MQQQQGKLKFPLWIITVLNLCEQALFLSPSESNYILLSLISGLYYLWNDEMKSGVKLPLWLQTLSSCVEWQGLKLMLSIFSQAKAFSCVIVSCASLIQSRNIKERGFHYWEVYLKSFSQPSKHDSAEKWTQVESFSDRADVIATSLSWFLYAVDPVRDPQHFSPSAFSGPVSS